LVTVRPTRLQLAVLTNLRGITNWQAAPAVVLLRFTALQGLRITNESGAEAATREVRPLLERECPPGRILNLDLVRFQRLDQRLTEAVSNLTASVAATNAKPAPGPGAKNPKDAPAVVPAVPTGVAWSGPARERILGLLREAGGLWSTENFPVRPTEFGDGLTALIRLIRSAPARAPATRASLAGGSRL
jgi:hypothetical protein